MHHATTITYGTHTHTHTHAAVFESDYQCTPILPIYFALIIEGASCVDGIDHTVLLLCRSSPLYIGIISRCRFKYQTLKDKEGYISASSLAS